MKIGKQKPDGVRAPNAEAARDAVRSEAQRLTGLDDPAGCRLTHRPLAVEDSGDSGHRDAGLGGDFLDGDAVLRIRP